MRFCMLILLLVFVTGCAGMKSERKLKSPCIELDDHHPCVRVSVNDWWMNGH